MLEKHTLSKSTYMYGCQCPKRLHLHKYRPDLRNPLDVRVQFIKDSGTSVGILAQQLFPGGIDCSPADAYGYQEAVVKTQTLIEQGVPILYEAAFQFNGLLCVLDILVKDNYGYKAYEVKGAGSVKEQYLEDAAFQYYVITNTGLALDDISIVHLNTAYIRNGALDVHQLFTKHSILKEIVALQNAVQQKIDTLSSMLKQPEPVMDIGPHCGTPYACDFINHCWTHIPKVDSIFDLVRGPAWDLYASGYRHLDDIPHDYNFTKLVAQQLAHYRSGETFIDTEKISSFLAGIVYPIYYLDFETVWPNVPEFDNARPFEQIPFQFSLHVQQNANVATEHYEFLGDGTTDPREALTLELLRLCGTTGTILCYNTSFEKQRIEQLALLFPQHTEPLLALTPRLIDLMTPFQKRWYYHPEFKGRFSIKNILPVLCPDLRYDKLVIREGNMAGMVYAQLKLQDDRTAALQREQLLAYCKLDTLAMVRVLEVLRASNSSA